LNKNDIIFLGIGGTGTLITSEMIKQDERYNTFFVNTSIKDVNKVPIISNRPKYLVPYAQGTGRDRQMGKVYARDNYKNIIDEIQRFRDQKNIFLVFSSSGGTGSSIAPVIASMLTQMIEDKKTHFETVNIICTLPNLDESEDALKNSIECWNELFDIKGINTMYFLDNNKRSIKNVAEINVEFAQGFNSFMNIPSLIGENGSIDNSDLGKIVLAGGCGAFYTLPKDETSTKMALVKAMKNSIFADFSSKRCSYLCTFLQEKFDEEEIQKEFVTKKEHFHENNQEENLVIASGFKAPKNAIEIIQMRLEELEDNDEDEDFSANIIEVKSSKDKKDIKSITKKGIPIQQKSDKPEDIIFDEAFWDKIMK